MKKKIVGILLMTLLIATITLPTVSAQPHIDQFQDICDETYFIFDYHWQEFVPDMRILEKVDVKVCHWFSGSPDMKMTIEQPFGTVLSTKEVSTVFIPEGTAGWVTFDVPNIPLTPGTKYYIRITAPSGSEYGWCAGYGDPYPKGDSSMLPDCDDFCFKTWCYKGKTRSSVNIDNEWSNPLFQWFFQQHPQIFPILRLIIQRLGLQ